MTTNTNAAPDNCTVLPDGSAFATASCPLPKNHWLYAPREYEPGAEEPKELPPPILTHAHSAAVVAAVRYAIRSATMCGKEKDFDPDALVQNAVYALCGPYGKAALSTAAQPPADGALNTIAAMFHSGEEIDGPDGMAMMVDMSVWNAALDSFEGIIGDEMEPAQPPAGWRMVPVEPTVGMCIAGDEARITVNDLTRTPAVYRAMIAAAPKAEPVPAVEREELRDGASYESMNLAAMVLSDCGHSSNYEPLLERVAGRIDRHVERLLTAQRADLTRRAQAEPVLQPERVPLTDDEIGQCLPLGVAAYSTLVGVDEIRAFVRAIEQFHGIKPAKDQS